MEFTKQELMIDYDEKEYKFKFYYTNKNYIGSFNVYQLIKYLTNIICPEFLSGIEIGTSSDIIEKFVCVRNINDDGSINIVLRSHLESNFIGNIDILLKLYKCINYFVINKFEQEITASKCEPNVSRNISNCIKQLIYLILNHSLKLIATISELIKNDNKKVDISKILLQYSIAIMNKINTFTKIEFDKKINDAKIIEDNINKLQTTKSVINNKMDKIHEVIQNQNKQLANILNDIGTVKSGGVISEISPIKEYLFQSSDTGSVQTSDTGSVQSDDTGSVQSDNENKYIQNSLNDDNNDNYYNIDSDNNTKETKIQYLSASEKY